MKSPAVQIESTPNGSFSRPRILTTDPLLSFVASMLQRQVTEWCSRASRPPTDSTSAEAISDLGEALRLLFAPKSTIREQRCERRFRVQGTRTADPGRTSLR